MKGINNINIGVEVDQASGPPIFLDRIAYLSEHEVPIPAWTSRSMPSLGSGASVIDLGEVTDPLYVLIRNEDSSANTIVVDSAADFSDFPQYVLPGKSILLMPEGAYPIYVMGAAEIWVMAAQLGTPPPPQLASLTSGLSFAGHLSSVIPIPMSLSAGVGFSGTLTTSLIIPPIINGDFETGDLTGWVIDGTNDPPYIGDYATIGIAPYSGTYFCVVGTFSGTEPTGDSSIYQEFTVPAGGGTLSFWHWDFSTDTITYDWQDAYITDTSGTILQTIFHQCLDTQLWAQQTVDMTPYAGTTVRIKFLAHEDGAGDPTGMFIDAVSLT